MIIVEQQYSEERYLGTDTHITDIWNEIKNILLDERPENTIGLIYY
jgi:hypothetical protein